MNTNQSRDGYQQALVLARQLGMLPLQAQCYFALGELAKKAGEKRGAHEHLSTALSMFRDIGMRSCLQKAEAASKAV